MGKTNYDCVNENNCLGLKFKLQFTVDNKEKLLLFRHKNALQ